MPNLQLQVFLSNQNVFRELRKTQSVYAKKAVNVWYTKTASGASPAAAYDLDANVFLTKMHKNGSVPSQVVIKIGSVVYTMDAVLSDPPLIRDINGGANELLMTVSTNLQGGGKGVGYIEWVPGYYMPQRSSAVTESGLTHKILEAMKPNPYSQAAFGCGVAGVYLIIIAIFVLAICLVDNYQKRQQ